MSKTKTKAELEAIKDKKLSTKLVKK